MFFPRRRNKKPKVTYTVLRVDGTFDYWSLTSAEAKSLANDNTVDEILLGRIPTKKLRYNETNGTWNVLK